MGWVFLFFVFHKRTHMSEPHPHAYTMHVFIPSFTTNDKVQLVPYIGPLRAAS